MSKSAGLKRSKINVDTPAGFKRAIERSRDTSRSVATALRDLIRGNESPKLTLDALGRMEQGRAFNVANHHRYEHNEIHLANGKRVDSINLSERKSDDCQQKVYAAL